MNEKMLIDAAIAAMKNSYSPYSGFCVGAAICAESGKVYTGANVENSSFSVTSCAERSALFAAVSAGERKFNAIAVVGGKGGEITDFCPPCGVCRQALSEFCTPDARVYLFDGKDVKSLTLGELLPESFSL